MPQRSNEDQRTAPMNALYKINGTKSTHSIEMEPSRSQSFSDRLVGAPTSFFLGVIGFLVVMLALSVQHSVRYPTFA